MNSYKARLTSFKKGYRDKSSSQLLKWPHPATWKVNPTTLAGAGFYFAPSSSDPDNAVCFMCDKEIGDWDEEDDPSEVHWQKCGQRCPWAAARCGAECGVYGTDLAQAPTGKTAENARLATFTKQNWPHDAVKNHGANSKNMAKAGLIYNCQIPNDDTALCPYCGVALHGWEPDDDPIKEHSTRTAALDNPCVFLTSLSTVHPKGRVRAAASTMAPPPVPNKPPGRSSSRKSMRSQRSPSPSKSDTEHEAAVKTALGRSTRGRPTTADASTSNLDDEEVVEVATAKPVGRGNSRKSVAADKTRKGARDNATEEEMGTDVTDTEGKRKRPGRTQSKASVKEAEEDDESDEPAQAPSTKGKKGRKTVAKKEEQVEYEIVLKEPSRKGSRKTSMASVASTHAPPDDTDVEMEELVKPVPKKGRKTVTKRDTSRSTVATDAEDEPEPPPTRVKDKTANGLGRSTRSKQSLAPRNMEDTEAITPAPKKAKGRTASRTLTRSQSVAPAEPESDVEEVATAAPSKAKPRTVSRTMTRSQSMAPTEVDSEPEEPQPQPKTKTRAKSKVASRSRSVVPEDGPFEEAIPAATINPNGRSRGKSMARSASPVPSLEPEEVTPAARSKPKGRTASRTVVRAPSRAASVASDTEEPQPAPAKGRNRTKSVARAPSRARSIVPEEEDSPPPRRKQGQTQPRKAPSRAASRAPSVASDEEEEAITAVPAKGRSGAKMATRAPSRARSVATEEEDDRPQSQKQAQSRASRPSSRASGRIPSVDSEEAEEVVTAAPPPKAKVNGRSRGASVARVPSPAGSVMEDEDVAMVPPKQKKKPKTTSAKRSEHDIDVDMEETLPPAKGKGKSASRQRSHSVARSAASQSDAERSKTREAPAKAKNQAKGPLKPTARPPSRARSAGMMSENEQYETADEQTSSPLPKERPPPKKSRVPKTSVVPTIEARDRASSLERSTKAPRDSAMSNDPLDVLDDDTISMPLPQPKTTNAMPSAKPPLRTSARPAAKPSSRAHAPPPAKAAPRVVTPPPPPAPAPTRPVAQMPPPDNSMDDDMDDDEDDIVEVSDEETRMFRLKPKELQSQPAPTSGRTSKADATLNASTTRSSAAVPERPLRNDVRMHIDPPRSQPKPPVPTPATPPPSRPIKPLPATPPTAKRIPSRREHSKVPASTIPVAPAVSAAPIIAPTPSTSVVAAPITSAPQITIASTPAPVVQAEPPLKFTPALTLLERVMPNELTEEERAMTVEQWIRREMQLEHDRFAMDTEARLKELEVYADKVRAQIKALPTRESVTQGI